MSLGLAIIVGIYVLALLGLSAFIGWYGPLIFGAIMAWLLRAGLQRDRRAAAARLRALVPIAGQAVQHLAAVALRHRDGLESGWLASTPDTLAFYPSKAKQAVIIPRHSITGHEIVLDAPSRTVIHFTTMTDRIETLVVSSKADLRPMFGIAPDVPEPPETKLPRATVVRRARE